MKMIIAYFVSLMLIVIVLIKGCVDFFELTSPSYFLTISTFTIGLFTVGFSVLITMGKRMISSFVNIVIGSVAVKLLLSMIFIAGLIYLDRENANANTVFFLALYLSFTTIEMVMLLKKSSQA